MMQIDMPVRNSTNILQCFLSSLLMNWTYISVGPSRNNWLIPFLSQTLHSICFLFPIQFLILDLNLLKNNGRKGSGPISLIPASPSLGVMTSIEKFVIYIIDSINTFLVFLKCKVAIQKGRLFVLCTEKFDKNQRCLLETFSGVLRKLNLSWLRIRMQIGSSN